MYVADGVNQVAPGLDTWNASLTGTSAQGGLGTYAALADVAAQCALIAVQVAVKTYKKTSAWCVNYGSTLVFAWSVTDFE